MRQKWLFVALCMALLLLGGCVTAQPQETLAPPTAATLPPVEQPVVEYTAPAIDKFYVSAPQGFLPREGQGLLHLAAGEDASVTLEKRPYLSDIRREEMSWFKSVLSQGWDAFQVRDFFKVRLGDYYGMCMGFVRRQGGTVQQGIALACQGQGELYIFQFTDNDGSYLSALRQAFDSVTLLAPGQYIDLQPQGTEVYQLFGGLSFQGEKGLQSLEAPGYAGAFQGQYCLVTFLEDMKTEASGLLELEDYGETVAQIHGLAPFREDVYGNLVSEQVAGGYYYFITVKETPTSFYLCQMVCAQSLYSRYRDQFALWAATVE